MKDVWKDGTRAVLLEPDDLLARLCATLPTPRMHLLRYFGVSAAGRNVPKESAVPRSNAAGAFSGHAQAGRVPHHGAQELYSPVGFRTAVPDLPDFDRVELQRQRQDS